MPNFKAVHTEHISSNAAQYLKDNPKKAHHLISRVFVDGLISNNVLKFDVSVTSGDCYNFPHPPELQVSAEGFVLSPEQYERALKLINASIFTGEHISELKQILTSIIL